MKTVTVLQNYTLTARIEIEVPDTYTALDTIHAVRDFPINATIESMLDEDSDLNEIKVSELILDSFTTGEMVGDFSVIDEEGNILR